MIPPPSWSFLGNLHFPDPADADAFFRVLQTHNRIIEKDLEERDGLMKANNEYVTAHAGFDGMMWL